MFVRLGRLATRYRWPLVVGWVAAAALVTLVAPNIDKVAVNDQRAFLPSSAPSLDAITTVKRYFPDKIAPSSSVLVIDAGKGGRADAGPTRQFIADTTAWLQGPDKPQVVDQILSPASADAQTAKALISPDGQVGLIVVRFSKVGTEDVTRQAIVAIQDRLTKAPAGVSTAITGDAAIIGAYDEATRKSIDSTTWITILLVIVILLVVYRSPVSPVIPLLTISLAYLISRGVVALLAESVMTVSGYTNIFLIVVLFGAGTDYCLFLISRFREEMADSHETGAAVERTVRTVGETIASSAGTVVVGLSTMALAELGLFNTTGPSVAVGVVIALLAGLTFTPALLSILGDHTFWPRKARHIGEGRFWHAWAGKITSRPLIPLVGTLVVLVPLAVYGQGQARDFDLLQDLPATMDAHRGFDTLAAHLGPGTMQPLTLVVTDPKGFGTADGLARMQQIQARVQAVAEVDAVRSFTESLQERQTLSVDKQLSDQIKGVLDGIAQLRTTLGSSGNTGSGSTQVNQLVIQKAAAGLMNLFSYLQQLGREYPQAQADPGYQQAMKALAGLAQAAGVTPGVTSTAGAAGAAGAAANAPDPKLLAALPAGLEQVAAGLEGLRKTFAAQPNALMLPATYLATNEELRALKVSYLSADGTAARLQVVLKVGPYAPEALAAVGQLRTAVNQDGATGVVEGSSAIVADLQASSNRDMVRVVIWVLAGVFVVLVLLLRALVAPLYLILTILLSYGATLGIVRVVFQNILGTSGVTWWVPIFMFVMLVALGMDYNIFLMGRVKEEVATSGNREGVRTAVARTGGIITSAGIIMAGTFGAMMSASILGLVQVGFAVAVGILLDTFVVRTALVPAIAVLLGRWSWWPRRQR
jgi:putative drug exporter of the RND superfamily